MRRPRLPRISRPFLAAPDGTARGGIVLLTESVIALTVLLVGILAAAIVFTRARETEARAVAETRAAVFADTVLNSLRAADARWAGTDTWHESWEAFIDGTTNVPLAGQIMWANTTSLVVRAGRSNTMTFLVYRHRTAEETDYVAQRMKYGLVVVKTNIPSGVRFTATLSVRPDRYASRNFLFYTEFFNMDE